MAKVYTDDAKLGEYQIILAKGGPDYAKQCIDGDNGLTDKERKSLRSKLKI